MLGMRKFDGDTIECPQFIAFEGTSHEDHSSRFNLGQLTQIIRVVIWQDPGFDFRRGCDVFFRLIRLSVLLSLSELNEKRIYSVFFFFGGGGNSTFLFRQAHSADSR